MKKKSCSMEKEILSGLKSGKLAAGLKKHLSGCPVCQESAELFKWMNNFRDMSLSLEPGNMKKTLPTAESLWEGAYSFHKPDKELVKKALRPLVFPRVLSYLAVVIVPIFIALFYLPGIKEFIKANPGSNTILSSLSSILTLLLKSLSFLLLPLVGCLLTLIIFIIITGFQPKKT